jgi:hypothetical protein
MNRGLHDFNQVQRAGPTMISIIILKEEYHFLRVAGRVDLLCRKFNFKQFCTAMLIPIIADKAIHQVQLEFSREYPFLRLEFFKPKNKKLAGEENVFSPFTLLKNAGLSSEGELTIEGNMTVRQLEKMFEQGFGLSVCVSRRSGLLWLHTSLTNNWTLDKQNEQGHEISLAINEFPGKAAEK